MLVLPEILRDALKEPFGPPVNTSELLKIVKNSPKPIITVGDQCLLNLLNAKIVPDIMIFDFKIKRKEIAPELKKKLAPYIKNPFVVLSDAGHISDELLEALDNVLNEEKGAVFVVGEDDLSSLVIMAYAKKGTLIYGQPDVGAVIVPLGDEDITARASSILAGMESEDKNTSQ